MKAPAHGFSALSTDLYEVTMACGYWKAGVSDHEAAFHVVFRDHPFGGQVTIACGLASAIDFLREFHFTENETAYLARQKGNDGRPLFDRAFLEYLRTLRITCDVDAMPEGTAVFPNEPLIRVTGPIIQCQMLETALLNILNFQSLIATKAARICLAAGEDAVIEYGLRRAQGMDGGLSASRAAYIGGCAGTSNLLAGQCYGIPVSGTQAHSWIMFFESESEAFEKYATAGDGRFNPAFGRHSLNLPCYLLCVGRDDTTRTVGYLCCVSSSSASGGVRIFAQQIVRLLREVRAGLK